MSTIDLLSPLPRAECEQRLRATVASEWSLLSASGVVGTIAGDSIRLRKKIYYRNSFQRRLYGQLSDAPGGGTRIHCEDREMNLKPVLIAAGAVTLLALAGVLWTIVQHRSAMRDVPIAAMLAPVGVIPLLFGIGILALTIGRGLARNERQFLIDFLRQTLDAREAA